MHRVKTCRSLILALLAVSGTGCPGGGDPRAADNRYPTPSREEPFFAEQAPRAPAYRKELEYLRDSGQLSRVEYAAIERGIDQAHRSFEVPRSLLWCVLFQESRLDRFKNAASRRGARGMGQFTPAALREINTETDHFSPGTRKRLLALAGPRALPLDFSLLPKGIKPRALTDRRRRRVPEQAPRSYFDAETSVAATAAYLNNRYRQLLAALEPMDVAYDPEAIWLMAAAAYNKGPRTINVLLTRQRLFGGRDKLEGILSSTKLSYALLTHPEVLDLAFRNLWPARRRAAYVDELVRNMRAIRSCASTEDPA